MSKFFSSPLEDFDEDDSHAHQQQQHQHQQQQQQQQQHQQQQQQQQRQYRHGPGDAPSTIGGENAPHGRHGLLGSDRPAQQASSTQHQQSAMEGVVLSAAHPRHQMAQPGAHDEQQQSLVESDSAHSEPPSALYFAGRHASHVHGSIGIEGDDLLSHAVENADAAMESTLSLSLGMMDIKGEPDYLESIPEHTPYHDNLDDFLSQHHQLDASTADMVGGSKYTENDPTAQSFGMSNSMGLPPSVNGPSMRHDHDQRQQDQQQQQQHRVATTAYSSMQQGQSTSRNQYAQPHGTTPSTSVYGRPSSSPSSSSQLKGAVGRSYHTSSLASNASKYPSAMARGLTQPSGYGSPHQRQPYQSSASHASQQYRQQQSSFSSLGPSSLNSGSLNATSSVSPFLSHTPSQHSHTNLDSALPPSLEVPSTAEDPDHPHHHAGFHDLHATESPHEGHDDDDPSMSMHSMHLYENRNTGHHSRINEQPHSSTHQQGLSSSIPILHSPVADMAMGSFIRSPTAGDLAIAKEEFSLDMDPTSSALVPPSSSIRNMPSGSASSWLFDHSSAMSPFTQGLSTNAPHYGTDVFNGREPGSLGRGMQSAYGYGPPSHQTGLYTHGHGQGHGHHSHLSTTRAGVHNPHTTQGLTPQGAHISNSARATASSLFDSSKPMGESMAMSACSPAPKLARHGPGVAEESPSSRLVASSNRPRKMKRKNAAPTNERGEKIKQGGQYSGLSQKEAHNAMERNRRYLQKVGQVNLSSIIPHFEGLPKAPSQLHIMEDGYQYVHIIRMHDRTLYDTLLSLLAFRKHLITALFEASGVPMVVIPGRHMLDSEYERFVSYARSQAQGGRGGLKDDGGKGGRKGNKGMFSKPSSTSGGSKGHGMKSSSGVLAGPGVTPERPPPCPDLIPLDLLTLAIAASGIQRRGVRGSGSGSSTLKNTGSYVGFGSRGSHGSGPGSSNRYDSAYSGSTSLPAPEAKPIYPFKYPTVPPLMSDPESYPGPRFMLKRKGSTTAVTTGVPTTATAPTSIASTAAPPQSVMTGSSGNTAISTTTSVPSISMASRSTVGNHGAPVNTATSTTATPASQGARATSHAGRGSGSGFGGKYASQGTTGGDMMVGVKSTHTPSGNQGHGQAYPSYSNSSGVYGKSTTTPTASMGHSAYKTSGPTSSSSGMMQSGTHSMQGGDYRGHGSKVQPQSGPPSTAKGQAPPSSSTMSTPMSYQQSHPRQQGYPSSYGTKPAYSGYNAHTSGQKQGYSNSQAYGGGYQQRQSPYFAATNGAQNTPSSTPSSTATTGTRSLSQYPKGSEPYPASQQQQQQQQQQQYSSSTQYTSNQPQHK